MAVINSSIILTCIVLIGFASIIIYFNIFIFRYSKKKRSLIKERMGTHISYLLIQVIISDGKEATIKRLRQFLSKSKNPHVSVNALATLEFVKLASTVSHDYLPAIQGLFLNLGLQHFNIKRATKGSLKQKLKAFEALSKLRIIEAMPYIKQYILEPNKALRAEAIMALMRISENPLFFLNNQKVTLSAWEAIKIHSMLKELPNDKIPQFTEWLNHRQKTVVLFCLRMILHYQQRADIEQLTRLSKSRSKRVANEAQKALILNQILIYSDPDNEENNQLETTKYKHLNVA